MTFSLCLLSISADRFTIDLEAKFDLIDRYAWLIAIAVRSQFNPFTADPGVKALHFAILV